MLEFKNNRTVNNQEITLLILLGMTMCMLYMRIKLYIYTCISNIQLQRCVLTRNCTCNHRFHIIYIYIHIHQLHQQQYQRIQCREPSVTTPVGDMVNPALLGHFHKSDGEIPKWMRVDFSEYRSRRMFSDSRSFQIYRMIQTISYYIIIQISRLSISSISLEYHIVLYHINIINQISIK